MTYDVQDCYGDHMGSSFGGIIHSPYNVVMQSTSQEDKNGREIFEGDIVRCGRMVYAIEWRLVFEEQSEVAGFQFFDHPQDYEVIGNIHENSDLLPSAL
ncbi:MAG: hypothetical protein IT428_26175 [Planctomycetaceae bacterium]|nr:hypothetical protein [Planctomycetaceae bacterium]